MRFAIAAAALCCSAPAFATGGFVCSSTDSRGPAISLAISHGIPGGVIGASLKENGRWRSTMEPKEGVVLDQWWIDRERTRVDIVHPETGACEAQLRVRNQGFGGTGTLVRKGRTYAVLPGLECRPSFPSPVLTGEEGPAAKRREVRVLLSPVYRPSPPKLRFGPLLSREKRERR